jgi:hypothetical protein
MRCRFLASVLSISVLTIGCGESGPNLQPGAGTVTIDGKPVPNAIVTFVSADGPASVGEADASGKFVLYGPGSKPGIVPGDYTVLVECPYDPNMGSSADGSDPGQVSTENACNIPGKYSLSDMSGLTETIPEGGNESISIELDSEDGFGSEDDLGSDDGFEE